MLERRYRQGKKATPIEEKPAEIDPENYFYVDSFWILNRTRKFSESGYFLPLSFTEIESFIRIMDFIHDVPAFVDVILLLDHHYLDIMNSKLNKKQQRKTKQHV